LTGKVFTKLLLVFLLVMVLCTAALDLVLRPLVGNSLRRQMRQSLTEKSLILASEVKSAPPTTLEQTARQQALNAGAQVSIYNLNGTLQGTSVSSPEDADSGSSGTPPEVFTAIRQHAPAVAEHNGVLSVAAPAGNYVVTLAHPTEDIDITLHLLRRDALIASLCALGVSTLLAAWIAFGISRRLKRIVLFANKIASGDLTARMEERRLDELSEVAHALDATAVRLERSFTDLERSRRELAALLDSMQEAVVAVTRQGEVSWSNAVMQRIAGTQIHEGRSLVNSVRDPEVLACVEGALRDGVVCFGRAISIAPGRTFEVSAAPTPGGGAVAVLHDVTTIENTERMRRDFIANVSHELRTPLTSISGFVEMLLDEPHIREEQAREFLSIILKNSTRMNRLTVDLLALASVESRDYRAVVLPVRASTLVRDAIESLAGMAMDSGVSVEFAGAPEDKVLADADVMNQVFGNLIENAMKYGRSGGRVLVGAQRTEERPGYVEFFVQDFGPGIAYEHLERIFERFYRVDKARSRESGGTGLGLAIVKHILHAHHGQIWAESELGSGATFRFTLPVAQ
jgi:two-component system phosphate regulon sensor histidine kinase PhoR